MIRMEVACFLVLAFLAAMYFTARREHTKLDRCFSKLLILSMVHLLLDGITVYTVNNLDGVPMLVNDILHRLFIGTMAAIFYLLYRYIVLLVEDETELHLARSKFSILLLVVGLVAIATLPIVYIETEKGNYSYGPAPFVIYACVAIYLFLTVLTLSRHWTQIHEKKRMAVSLTLMIEIICLVLQVIVPLSLISGMGIMLVNLSFYLTLENPDILLVQQVQEEKKKAEEANAAKTAFLSNMSHEIRTPMNAVVGMAEILLRTDLTEEQREYLQNIKSSGQSLVAIINDILDISKIEAGKLEIVENIYDFGQMLGDIRIMILNRIGDKPVELLYEIDKGIPNKLYGDGLRIRQVIVNLMNNAVKFTESGYVKLTVKEVLRSEEEIILFVAVEDTGQGIREENLEKIFGAFDQVDVKMNRGKEGTGLGLAISRELVGMMGGHLQVKSEYGVGSEFYFTMRQKRVSEEMEEQAAEQEAVETFIAPEAKILIVDDNAMNLKVVAGLLAPFQMQLDTADSGKQAIAMIQKKKYDLVFMDHMMPGMDGVEATGRIRALEGNYYKNLPIIALTANAMSEAQKLFAKASMNGFVAKPIEMVQMVRVLLRWLPKELIQDSAKKEKEKEKEEAATTERTDADTARTDIYHLPGIQVKEGIKYTGSEELFVSALGDFYKLIDTKAEKVEKCLFDQMIKDYTIEVHALKSNSRMIGAVELSKRFEHLEQLGNEENLKEMQEETPEVLALYRSYKEILKPFGIIQEEEKKEVPKEEIIWYLQGMQEAAEAGDLDTIDDIMEHLEKCRLPADCISRLEKLRVAVADVALEATYAISKDMEHRL